MGEIQKKVSFSLLPWVDFTTTANLFQDFLIKLTEFRQTGFIQVRTTFLQFIDGILRKAYLSLFLEYLEKEATITLNANYKQLYGLIKLSEELIQRIVTLFLTSGGLPAHINPFKEYTYLYLIDNSNKEIINIQQIPSVFLELGNLNLVSASGVSDTTNIILTDELGPEIFNEIPPSGSKYNNPDTNISFDLIDTGGATILESSVNLAIDDTPVITSGVNVTPTGYGSTTFIKLDNSHYQFEFNPLSPFNIHNPVIISGTAKDSVLSGNISNYLYQFELWKYESLLATITGIADVDAPFLDNIFPGNLIFDVPVDTNISFDIVDEHTGLKLTSVMVSIKDEIVISGGIPVNSDYNVTVSSISGGRGMNYVINPFFNFDFFANVSVDVYAEDLYGTPNVLDTSFSFITQSNSHLVASGLQIYQETAYESMNVNKSYTTAPSTPFVIDFINTSGTPLSTTGSFVSLNGNSIPTTFIEDGGPDHFKVYFDLEPDYETDADLIFHVQQSGTVHGNYVYREFSTRLLWGYEVCYNPEEDFSYNKDIVTLIQLADFADYYTFSSLVTKFRTTPMRSSSLRASINGLPQIYNNLLAEIISHNTFFEYGKTMHLRLEASDYAGNNLIYNWSFTIENRP